MYFYIINEKKEVIGRTEDCPKDEKYIEDERCIPIYLAKVVNGKIEKI